MVEFWKCVVCCFNAQPSHDHHRLKTMTMKSMYFWQAGALACSILFLFSCNSPAPAEAPQPQEPESMTLDESIELRGEPCVCVSENLEAMTGLLETLQSMENITSQELNIQIAQRMLPCMKPTGDTPADLEYSRAMGRCDRFADLTEVMSGIKLEVQERILKETEDAKQNVLNGAQGANAILDELKES